MTLVHYEDAYCYYFWKKHGIASSWGLGPCFLDSIQAYGQDPSTTVGHIAQTLIKEFGVDYEYGLLNRLDNDTAGLLYFAKNKSIKAHRKQLQKQDRIHKYYLADIPGDIEWSMRCVAHPIAHHPQAKDRMIVYDPDQSYNTNIKRQSCYTRLEKLYYDPEKNYTCVLITIQKGVRHQIRAHLASIGHPIIGEKIYKKKKDMQELHLWSIGVYIENSIA